MEFIEKIVTGERMEKSTAFRTATGQNRKALDLQQETGLPYQQALDRILSEAPPLDFDIFEGVDLDGDSFDETDLFLDD